MITVPPRLAERLASEGDAGRAWVDALPAVLDRLADAWELSLGAPFRPGGMGSVVLPVRRAVGGRAVLKVPFPDPDAQGEAEALAAVGGNGAVRLLGLDPPSGALLLEAADPTRTLLDLADAEAAADRAADLLARWWRPAPAGLRPLAQAAAGYRCELAARRALLEGTVPRHLVDRALDTLAGAAGVDDTLLHVDLHQGNVLAADREPWLAIDPQPLAGPPAYDLEPLLRDGRPGLLEDGAAVRRRFDRLTERLGLDREAARAWVLARSLLTGSWSVAIGDDRFGWAQIRRGLVVATG